MKIRQGFVSNSSSSSFIIKNISKTTKTWKDFANFVFKIEKEETICNGKYPGKFKGCFTKKQLINAKGFYQLQPKEEVIIESDDEDYENPISVLRMFFYQNQNNINKSFYWKETYNSQAE